MVEQLNLKLISDVGVAQTAPKQMIFYVAYFRNNFKNSNISETVKATQCVWSSWMTFNKKFGLSNLSIYFQLSNVYTLQFNFT